MMPDRGISQGLQPDDTGMTVGRNPPRLSEILRGVLAFICGALIFPALVSAFNRLAEIEAPARQGMEKPGELVWSLSIAMLLTGFLVARLTGRWGIVVSTVLSVLLAFGAGRAHLHWQGIESPLAEIVGLVLFVPCALLSGFMAHRMARREARKRDEELLTLPLPIRQHAAVVWLAFFLSAGMTAAGVWVLTLEEATLSMLGVLGIVFFGGAALFLGWRGLHNTPLAVFRDEGVELPAFQAVIPWSEIIDAAAPPFHPVAYVRLQLVDPQKYLSRLSALQTALSQTGESEPNIGIALTGTPYTVEQIVALVQSRARGRRF